MIHKVYIRILKEVQNFTFFENIFFPKNYNL